MGPIETVCGIGKRPARAAVVHLDFRAGSSFPVPVCTKPSSMDRTSRCNKVDTVRLDALYRLNLLLLKGQRCVPNSFRKLTFKLFKNNTFSHC